MSRDPQENGSSQQHANSIQLTRGKHPPRQDRHAAGNTAKQDGVRCPPLQPYRIHQHIQHHSASNNTSVEGIQAKRPAQAANCQQSPQQPGFPGRYDTSGQRTAGCPLHAGIQIPVKHHIENRGATHCQEKTAHQGSHGSRLKIQAATAEVPCRSRHKQKTGLQVLDQRPVCPHTKQNVLEGLRRGAAL